MHSAASTSRYGTFSAGQQLAGLPPLGAARKVRRVKATTALLSSRRMRSSTKLSPPGRASTLAKSNGPTIPQRGRHGRPGPVKSPSARLRLTSWSCEHDLRPPRGARWPGELEQLKYPGWKEPIPVAALTQCVDDHSWLGDRVFAQARGRRVPAPDPRSVPWTLLRLRVISYVLQPDCTSVGGISRNANVWPTWPAHGTCGAFRISRAAPEPVSHSPPATLILG